MGITQSVDSEVQKYQIYAMKPRSIKQLTGNGKKKFVRTAYFECVNARQSMQTIVQSFVVPPGYVHVCSLLKTFTPNAHLTIQFKLLTIYTKVC